MSYVNIADIGTTNIKNIFMVDTQECRFILPTAIGPSRPLEFGSGEGVEVSGLGEYFVGRTAIDYSPNLIWGRSEEWLMSDYYKSLHLYCIGKGLSMHIDQLRKNKQGYTHLFNETLNINLATAVPYANWSNRSEIALNLTGNYVIRMLDNDNVFKISVNRETGKSKKGNQVVLWPRIALQGWSAFLANGKPVDNPGQPNVVVIGLGGRNVVYCTMRNSNGRWSPVDGLVGSTEGGILNVVENLMGKIERQFKIELNHQIGIEALKSSKVAGHDITDMVDEVTKPYVDGILSLIAEKWNERQLQPFISEIRLTGGGAILLGDKIKHRLVKVDSHDPLWSEAVGMKGLI